MPVSMIFREITSTGNLYCSRYVTITNTHYFIITANEEFKLNENMYNKIEIGRRYEVVVTGWKNTETPRNIIEVTE